MIGLQLLAAALIFLGMGRPGPQSTPEPDSSTSDLPGPTPSGVVQDDPASQDPPPRVGGIPRPRLDRVVPGLRDRKTGPLLAADGKEVRPGRIPDGTSPQARALWEAVNRATVVGDDDPDRVHSFAVTFDVTGRHDNGKNDLTIDVQFMDRDDGDWMRAYLQRSGRVQMRGPKGNWLLDKKETVSLDGRENITSRQDMDQWIAIANHFLTVVNTDEVRMVSLALAGSPIDRIPEERRAAAEGLTWLQVESPDFHLYDIPEGKGEPVLRTTLGVRTEDGRVVMSLIEDTDPRNANFARFVMHEKWVEMSDRLLPKTMFIYLIDPETRSFYPRPVYEFTLYRNGTLNTPFEESQFQPE